jgi:hypothetical protein
MTRDAILKAIRTTAAENGGRPLGARAFHSSTSISRTDLWNAGFPRYGDAVKEAGLKPNKLQTAFDSGAMLTALAAFTRHLSKFPTISDLKAARTSRPDLPSYEAFYRLAGGSYAALPELLLAHCRASEVDSDVVALLEANVSTGPAPAAAEVPRSARVRGFVYLAKHGRDFKIGRSNDVARRRREISLLLPTELEHVHIIETDDPEGIERYWHNRFQERQIRGEWYRLSPEDVAAFKRRHYQ